MDEARAVARHAILSHVIEPTMNGAHVVEILATLLADYAADAVAEAVKEMGRELAHARECERIEVETVARQAEEIARLNRDTMRHESDRAVREKEIARLTKARHQSIDYFMYLESCIDDLYAQTQRLTTDLAGAEATNALLDEEIARRRAAPGPDADEKAPGAS